MLGMSWRNYTQPSAHSRAVGAHGASGAIYSVISFYACVMPTAQFLFFGIMPMPAWVLISGIFLYDGYSAFKGQASCPLSQGGVSLTQLSSRLLAQIPPGTLVAFFLALATSLQSV